MYIYSASLGVTRRQSAVMKTEIDEVMFHDRGNKSRIDKNLVAREC